MPLRWMSFHLATGKSKHLNLFYSSLPRRIVATRYGRVYSLRKIAVYRTVPTSVYLTVAAVLQTAMPERYDLTGHY